MRRMQLFEFADFAWFPAAWRRNIGDVLSWFGTKLNPYGPLAPKLKAALERMDCRRIVDLGSGSAGPITLIQRQLREQGWPVSITLTDFFPDPASFARAAAAADGPINFIEGPMDFRAVPAELTGFRTMFASFHHLAPPDARAILRDAAAAGQGIGVFEFTGRHPIQFVSMLLSPITVWLITPWLRPFSFSRLFWTYLVPVVPLLSVWEDVVSNLRTYSPSELRELTAGLDSYIWDIGQVPSRGGFKIIYLFGYPGAPVPP